DFLDPLAFPRTAMLGLAPFPMPQGRVPEVVNGLVPSDAIRPPVMTLSPSRLPQAIHPHGGRTASLGLRLPYLNGDEPFTLHALDPQRPVMRFQLPAEQPRVQVRLRGGLTEIPPTIYSVKIQVSKGIVAVVWGGSIVLPHLVLPDQLDTLEHRVEWVRRS